jgi:hypothetical protein
MAPRIVLAKIIIEGENSSAAMRMKKYGTPQASEAAMKRRNPLRDIQPAYR